jgi:5-oxopent-3-ene-1,2,5-tricarboxylate decarboxylase / 2-hydroxyhepta-2,4-diene-1,7-dioate isomerase
MKRGRILYQGQVHAITEHANGVQLATGQVLSLETVSQQAQWLPPFEARTVFALALNYADHAKELAFKPPEEPLVFLKGRNGLVGHDAVVMRPPTAQFMHYECELAVVIGKPARNLSKAQAMDVVAGYTIANDYAIRNYLENYYRPNFKVKSRDTCTPIGPWLVDRDDIADPQQLRLTTHVNGQCTQAGTTADMIFSVSELVAYLSSFMTLAAGDVILTGTPEGLADVQAGDVVECAIEGLGSLRHTTQLRAY